MYGINMFEGRKGIPGVETIREEFKFMDFDLQVKKEVKFGRNGER